MVTPYPFNNFTTPPLPGYYTDYSIFFLFRVVPWLFRFLIVPTLRRGNAAPVRCAGKQGVFI
jgi:hypothetical protein